MRILDIKILLTAILTVAFCQISTAQINFTNSSLQGQSVVNPTVLDFGPDDRLYVAQQNGQIYVYTVVRDSADAYKVTATETINLIKNMPNHNDDGTLNLSLGKRQVTGMLLKGTAANPIIFVTSSDPRIAVGYDSNLDTNSGILSKLSWNGSSWEHVDLVRGLPRCEENHSTNAIAFDEINNVIYLCSGGNTNMGAPSNSFAYTPEYAYSSAILSLDMDSIDNIPVTPASGSYAAYVYDLPTLDDEDRAGVNDSNDPFGGNDGKNQAKVTVGSPLQVHSPGWRNAYDIILSSQGLLYSIDNAGNSGWGGPPISDTLGNCDNTPNELNSVTHDDNLHLITGSGFYGGHPNPTRASTSVTFNSSNPQAAIDSILADGHCDYLIPGIEDGALAVYPTSCNGFDEYTASNFSGALQGDLFATCFNDKIYRVQLNDSGTVADSNKVFFSGFGSDPLDLICLNDSSPFPGTIWACMYGSSNIVVFEPSDFSTCSGLNTSYSLDDDNDGYSNADETDNATDPCNPASTPDDFDGDDLSDLNDPDDDSDGILDIMDAFALDSSNGSANSLPVRFDFDGSADGGIQNWGFTGIMINDSTNYKDQFDTTLMTVGGAGMTFSIDSIPVGDALGSQNNQNYGFQIGVAAGDAATPFTFKSSILDPFPSASGIPVNDQSMGIFIGTGDQDNYLKFVCDANNGNGGLRILYEDSSFTLFDSTYNVSLIDSSSIVLYLTMDPTNNTVTPFYSFNQGVSKTSLPAVSIPEDWISDVMACGFISTSGPSAGNKFKATWDWLDVRVDPVTVPGDWKAVPDSGSATARYENGFVQVGNKFVLLGGYGVKPVDIYNIDTQIWSQGSAPPTELHHFQALEMNGLIYCLGAYEGTYPNETKVPDVYIYDVVADKWMKGPTIPSARQRGSTAAVVYNNKIYLIGGLTQGHFGTWTNYLDEYDPSTNTWTALSNAPHTRDHFAAVVADDKIFCIGGMASGHGGPIGLDSVRAEIDVYDFNTSTWITLPDSADLPIPRSGLSAGLIGNEIIVFGGESKNRLKAHGETSAFDIINHSWRSLDTLIQGRHGTQGITSNSGIYVTAGSSNRGATPEINSFEMYHLFGTTSPNGSAFTASSILLPYTYKNLGSVNTNGLIDEELTIFNTIGDQGILIDSVKLDGCTCFSLTGLQENYPIVLAPGDSFNLKVRFQPIVSDTFSTTLKIFTSASSQADSLIIEGIGDSTTNYITRINTGGPSYISVNTDPYAADNYYTNGGTYSNPAVTSIDSTVDDSLYFTERSGATGFSYNIPVLNAKYDVILHFAELYWGVSAGGGPGKRVFDVDIEGNNVLSNFDLATIAPPKTAITRLFGVQVTDAFLDIDFGVVTDQPKISAIEVIPVPYFTTWYIDLDNDNFGGLSDSVLSYSQPDGYVANNTDCDDNDPTVYPGAAEILDGIDNDCDSIVDEGVYLRDTWNNCGGPQYITTTNDTFSVDQNFTGGAAFSNFLISDITNTVEDDIYKTERTGSDFSYSMPVENNLNYNLRLHFAEIYYGATGGAAGGNGKRVFDVIVEGDTLLDNYDIYAEVGAESAIIKEFNLFISDSILNIQFVGIVDQAKISAIEIILLDTLCDGPYIDSMVVSDVTCAGADDGSIDLHFSGGTAPFTYSWTNGATTQDISNISGGSYAVLITDDEGCSTSSYANRYSASKMVSAPANMNFSISMDSIADVVDITMTGPDSVWYAYGFGHQLMNMSYCLVTTGAGAISERKLGDHNAGVLLTNSLISSSYTSNGGIGTTNVTRSLAGLDSNYYSFSSDSVALTLIWGYGSGSNLAYHNGRGATTITLTKDSAVAVVNEPTEVSINMMTPSHVTCSGGSDGAIDLEVNGGSTPYTYSWSNGSTSQDLTNIAAGTYSVTVSDNNGCTTDDLAFRYAGNKLVSGIANMNIELQLDSVADSLRIEMTGPDSVWYSYGFGKSLMNGSYCFVTTGAGAISERRLGDHNAGSLLTPSVSSSSYTSSGGIGTSVITRSLAGLDSNYYDFSSDSSVITLIWAYGSGPSLAYHNGRGATTVILGPDNASVTIEEPVAFSLSSIKGNISCNDLDNGTASMIPSGGIAPYSYSWDTNPVETTSSIDSLAGGAYTCTVTDDAGCTASRSVSIFNPSEIIALIFADNPGPGDINLAVSGGIAPYSYNWSNGATTEDLFGMPTGFYFCQISDWNGCAKIKTVTLSSPPEIKAFEQAHFKNHQSSKSELFVFPNPTDDIVNVILSSADNSFVSISMFDYTGSLVLVQKSQLSIGVNQIEIPTDKLPAGLYHMQVNYDSQVQFVKIVIND